MLPSWQLPHRRVACLLLAQVLEQRTRISAVRHVGEASGGSVSDLPLLNNFHNRNS